MRSYLYFSLFALLSICISNISFADNGATQKSITPVSVNLKQHGYHLGDYINMQLIFSLPKETPLDELSLPLPGPVNAWFDLIDIQLKQHTNVYQLNLVWQVFATVEKTQSIPLPAVTLQTEPITSNNHEVATPAYIFAPDQHIYLSPTLPNLITSETPKPLIKPAKFDTSTPAMFAVLSLCITLLLFTFWLWLEDKLSFWPRSPGALTTLNRQFSKHKPNKRFSINELHKIQQALSSTAKQSLYPNTLDQLYVNAPYLKSFQTEIDDFFHSSWSAIYCQNKGDKVLNTQQTLSWIKAASRQERLYQVQQRKGLLRD